MLSKLMQTALLFLVIPGSVIGGIIFFGDRQYYLVSMILAISICLYYMLAFEGKKHSTRRIVLLAIQVALCVAGRFLFVAVPGFKPVTAIVVMTGIYFGSEAGMVTGAMAALVSNVLFGQGPWTPFQMIAWGSIGGIAGAGMLHKMLSTRAGLVVFGVFSGIWYSLIMDLWSTLALDGTFLLTRFAAKVGTSLPFMVIYAVSNVVFLLLMQKPMGNKLARVKRVYRI